MPIPKHLVAIFGGAVSGAEAAYQLTKRGIPVVVFDQNTLPYGKIEDGLPKWHSKLRDKEETKINSKLSHPLVQFVPNVALGTNLDFNDLLKDWGFSAILLATGAWKDRPLPIRGIDRYVNKGLYYQNPFIYWYNHFHEPSYAEMQYKTPDKTIIIGGGLASLDVAKVIMFQNVEKALRARGIEENLFTLDRSIAKVLDKHQLTLEDLGIEGCTLYYRRRIKDMPLSSAPTDTPELLAKTQKVHEKILNNYQSKYLFKMAPCHVPVNKIVENGRLVGLMMQKTQIIDRKVIPIEGTEYEVRSPLVIASIGSIPEPIEGIPMEWQTFKVNQEELCRIEGYDNVFALGNAVTGRGNILESLKHGRALSNAIADRYFDQEVRFSTLLRTKETAIAQQIEGISTLIRQLPEIDRKKYAAIQKRVVALQHRAAYKGNFMEWVGQHLPLRLEALLGEHL
jgi:NADPH-dependent glutamate synthase beta subunit-like oxidoreductase